MKPHYTHVLFISIVLLTCLQACSILDHSISAIADSISFNTKKDPLAYTVEDKIAYRHYLLMQKARQREQEKEIIKRLKKNKNK